MRATSEKSYVRTSRDNSHKLISVYEMDIVEKFLPFILNINI